MGRATGTATFVLEEEVDTDVARVRIVAGPDQGREELLGRERATIGTAADADLRLSDPTVSRLHCELAREPAGVRLRDLGSKNGCWLGGARVIEAVLFAGTRLRVGSTTLELETARTRLKVAAWRGGNRLEGLVGASPKMHALFAQIARIAGTDTRVLLRGESGTGKELVARALHDLGPRHGAPFVVVDGASLSRQLADLELFGHARGAFTGADRERAGAFERAHGGTLFLDEIAELPVEVQPKLLRALEDQTVQRVGEGERRAVDVRVICATHRPLEQMVNEGAFREDLLYRIRVVELVVPPLRERGRDVILIARALCEKMAPGEGPAAERVERELERRAQHTWPGNVRELRSFVRRVLALGEAGPAMTGLPADEDAAVVRGDLPYADAKKEWARVFERRYTQQAIDEAGGNITEAARRAGVSRAYFYRMLDRVAGAADDQSGEDD